MNTPTNKMTTETYNYRGIELKIFGRKATGFICFTDETGPLIKAQKTAAKALANGQKLIDLFCEDTGHDGGRKLATC